MAEGWTPLGVRRGRSVGVMLGGIGVAVVGSGVRVATGDGPCDGAPVGGLEGSADGRLEGMGDPVGICGWVSGTW